MGHITSRKKLAAFTSFNEVTITKKREAEKSNKMCTKVRIFQVVSPVETPSQTRILAPICWPHLVQYSLAPDYSRTKHLVSLPVRLPTVLNLGLIAED